MSSPVIHVENLSKRFILSHEGNERYTALRDVVANKAKRLVQRKSKQTVASKEEFWALKDVNFTINQGDRVGIIGRNGAGKSTLLKILSRITEPTKGRIRIQGRVASLLEVGTGFHPELSGRENIFLNGAILGMKRSEIRLKFDEIVDFAEVEKFLDTPVKRYSSGMYVRLAFSVAAHLEPDILIIDEVLSVGDVQFQKKCLGKMEDVSEKDGRTVIFVSHDMAAISALTENSIYLKKGQIEIVSNTESVIKHYLQTETAQKGVYESVESNSVPKIIRAEIITSETNYIHKNGEDLKIAISVHMPYQRDGMALSIQICDERETPIVFTYLFDADTPSFRTAGNHHVICNIPNCDLYQGNYYLKLHLAESKGREKFEEVDKVCEFEVKMMGKIIEWGWQKNLCIYTPEFNWILK